MTQHTIDQARDMGSLPLGIALTAVIAAAFFTFIGFGTFDPAILATQLTTGHEWSIGLASGLGLIAASALSTIAYSVSAGIALQNAPRQG